MDDWGLVCVGNAGNYSACGFLHGAGLWEFTAWQELMDTSLTLTSIRYDLRLLPGWLFGNTRVLEKEAAMIPAVFPPFWLW